MPNLTIEKPSETSFQGLYSLIKHYSDERIMLPKTMDDLYKYRRGFRLLVERPDEDELAKSKKDGFISKTGPRVIACAFLDLFTPTLAEVKSLAVMPGFQGQGLGKLMVEDCEREARELGIKKIFALTYEDKFFGKLGYEVAGMETLPEKVFKECMDCPFQDTCNEIAVVKYL